MIPRLAIFGVMILAASGSLAPAAGEAAADTRKFLAALASAPSSPAADALLADALASPHALTSGAALRRLRAGDGSAALAGQLAASIDRLPTSRQALVLDALCTRTGAAGVLRPLLRQRLETGDATTRADILPVLGIIAAADDVPIILGYMAAEFPVEVREAARDAFRRATAPGIDGALLATVAGPDDQSALDAMKALVDRNAVTATGPLWVIALGPDAPRRSPALDALALLLPVAEIPVIWQRMNEAEGTPMLARLGELNWVALRRHPDPSSAATAMMEAAAHSKEATKALLERQAKRLLSRVDDTAKAPAIKVPEEKDPAVLAPDRHDLLLSLDCGPADRAEHSGAVIRRLEGAAFAFGGSTHPLATVDFGKMLRYEITGLNPKETYVLGLAAWDGDMGKRNQMLRINGRTIVPEFLPLAYHSDRPVSARFHVPLDGLVPADGKVAIEVRCLAGPNAVVSELRLYQRKAGAEAQKKVLILTGDDYPGHLWRETGPALAAILRADPRFEVTISESPYLLGSVQAKQYDVVLLHFKNYENRTPTTSAMKENLARYVAEGGGLVVAHFGCGAMQDWDGFVRVAGRVWDPSKRGHDPYGEFLVRFTDHSHPVVSSLVDFQTTDELYTCLTGTTGIQALAVATSKSDKQDHPMAMVHTPGKGRVFLSPLGHDVNAILSAGTRAIYLRGTQWAAGIECRNP